MSHIREEHFLKKKEEEKKSPLADKSILRKIVSPFSEDLLDHGVRTVHF